MRRAWLFSVTFCSVFVAYGTTEIVQSSLFGGAGYACLLIVYSCFMLSSLLAPLLVRRIGPLATLWRCGCGYFFCVLVGAFADRAPPGVRLLACAVVGLSGGGFWSAQALYMTTLSQAWAVADPSVGVSGALSRSTSAFFVVFSTAQVLSQLLASAILLGFGDAERSRAVTALFALLTVLAALGTAALSQLGPPDAPGGRLFRTACCTSRGEALAAAEPDRDAPAAPAAPADVVVAGAAVVSAPDDSAPTVAAPAGATPAPSVAAAAAPAFDSPPPPTPREVFSFLLREPALIAILPLLFYGGGCLGFVLGPFLGSFSARFIGAGNVGFVGAAYNLTCVVFALPTDALVRRAWFGRRWAIAVGVAMHSVWFIVAGVLLRSAPSSSGSGSPADFALVFVSIIVFALAQPVFQSQLPALLQAWYTEKEQSTKAVAVYRVFFSLGFMAAQGISLAYLATGDAALWQQCAIWAAQLLLSGAALAAMHLRGARRID
jgi:MFS family permease